MTPCGVYCFTAEIHLFNINIHFSFYSSVQIFLFSTIPLSVLHPSQFLFSIPLPLSLPLSFPPLFLSSITPYFSVLISLPPPLSQLSDLLKEFLFPKPRHFLISNCMGAIDLQLIEELRSCAEIPRNLI